MRKKTKMILSTAFCASALALAGGALMSANTLPASAAATPVMKIKGANLAIEDNVHILFALSLENVHYQRIPRRYAVCGRGSALVGCICDRDNDAMSFHIGTSYLF